MCSKRADDVFVVQPRGNNTFHLCWRTAVDTNTAEKLSHVPKRAIARTTGELSGPNATTRCCACGP